MNKIKLFLGFIVVVFAFLITTNSAKAACVPNYGRVCVSAPNACGQRNTGTIQCNGTCSATTPANPANYGSSCTSAPNACGQRNTGTIQCNGTCSATTPANPANYGSSCTSAPNACGQRNTGTIQCNGTCSATTPANPANYGSSCTSAPNACGQRNTGTIQCNGTCSATTPANPANYGVACNRNACGGTGTITCSGSCSASAPSCDTTPPSVSGTYSPTSPTNAQQVSFTGTASDTSGISYIYLYADGSFVKTCSGATSCSYTGGPYAVGSHTFSVSAWDASLNANSNTASYGFSVTAAPDTTPPSVSGSMSPSSPTTANTVTFSGNASDSQSGVNSMWIFVDSAFVKSCPAPATSCSYTGGPYSAGSHNYEIRAKDNADNWASAGVKGFTISMPLDTTPPSVSGTYSPTSPTNAQQVSFTGTASDTSGISYIYLYADGSFVKTCSGATSCSYTGGPYAVGSHTFSVSAWDASLNANSNTASYGFNVSAQSMLTALSGWAWLGVDNCANDTSVPPYNCTVFDSNNPRTDPLGWVSLNCNDAGAGGCATSNYKVSVSAGGDLFGYAWSDSLGWISFESADVGSCPQAPCQPTWDSGTGCVSGWAKVLSIKDAAAVGNSGGWQGWIKLRDNGLGSNSFGVNKTNPACPNPNFAYAGTDELGWLNFTPLVVNGTGTISVTSNIAGASFTLSGPATYSGSGVSWSKNDATAPGNYTITWNNVSGYTAPAPSTQYLNINGTISFSGTYTAATGTINVTSTPSSASFVLAGPSAYIGITPYTNVSASIGAYTITWSALLCYSAPSGSTQNLASGGTINFNGNYSQSAPATAPTLDFGSVTHNSAVLSWSSVSCATTYYLYKFNTGSDVYVGPALSYPDGTLLPSTTYSYKVTACNSVGCGPDSNIISFVTPAPPVVNGIGEIKVTSNISSASFTLTGPATYSGSGVSWSKNDATAPGNYTITWNNVAGYTAPAPSTQYLNINSSISFSGIYTANIGTINVTSNIAGASFTLSGPATYSGSGVFWSKNDATAPGNYTITWNNVAGYTAPANSTRYLNINGTISFSGNYTSSIGTVNVTSTPSPTPFTLTGPSPFTGNTPYTNVSASIGAYTITWSALLCYSAPSGSTQNLASGGTINFNGNYSQSAPATAPTLNYGSVTHNSAVLSWNGVSCATTYYLYKFNTGSDVYVGPALSYPDGTLLPSTTYSYKVTACNSVGCGPDSNIISFVTPAPPNTPPSAINLAATPPDYCSSGPSAILSWTFSDPDSGSSQTAYQVQIATDAGFTIIIKDTGKLTSSSLSYATPAGTLNYNQTYYWRVMVWDNYDAPSVFANGPNFSTPVHAYPTADFTYLPAIPLVGQEITFTDASTAFGGASITTRNWDFCKDATCPNKTATGTPVNHTYDTKSNYTVELVVSDSTPPVQGGPFTCLTTKVLDLTKSLLSPGWKEVIPK